MLEAVAIRRQQLIGAADDHRDLQVLAAPERAQVAEIARVAADEADGFERLRAAGCRMADGTHSRDVLAAALDREPVAEVVGEHDGEAARAARPGCSARC